MYLAKSPGCGDVPIGAVRCPSSGQIGGRNSAAGVAGTFGPMSVSNTVQKKSWTNVYFDMRAFPTNYSFKHAVYVWAGQNRVVRPGCIELQRGVIADRHAAAFVLDAYLVVVLAILHLP